MSDLPKTIEHDENEPPRDTSKPPWLLLACILVFVWSVTLTNEGIEWRSVLLGGFTAMIFTLWAIDATGNKVPLSWRRRPTDRL
ncbi:hypothetical protein [Aureimonas sp. AU20]|uniref:hypothetical protein n=1 Tax=Aureimonas sp. AU20 TaxID=1349819 RepID=UPI00071F8FF4|nr:hypothetical protein [Aureimonas sp. AU20]ALN73522.1 hypothetical protein M673_12422 [Aureimonas sp. AU20]